MDKISHETRGIKEIELFGSQEIAFIGEQNGEAEGALKAKLIVRFQSDIHVNEAYLECACATTAIPLLRLRCASKLVIRFAPVIIEAVASEFRKMFRTDATLDILFLSREQQGRIALVANPFYKQHAYRA